MQSPTLSTLPSPMHPGLSAVASGSVQEEGLGGDNFAALLRDQSTMTDRGMTFESAAAPLVQPMGAQWSPLPRIAEPGRTLPPPGKDAGMTKDPLPLDGLMAQPALLLDAVPLLAIEIATSLPAPGIEAEREVLANARVSAIASGPSLAIAPPAMGTTAQLAASPVAQYGLSEAATAIAADAAQKAVVGGATTPAPVVASPPNGSIPVPITHASPADTSPVAPPLIAVRFVEPLIPTVALPAAARVAETAIRLSDSNARGASPVVVPTVSAQLTVRDSITAAVANDTPRGHSDGRGEQPKFGADIAAVIARAMPSDASLASNVAAALVDDRTVPTTGAHSTPAASGTGPGRVDLVTNVVDRLVAAREAGMSAISSVAIAHREFGDITVNFVAANDALEVSLAAEDHAAQRSLVAALHSAERTATRDAASLSTPHDGAATPQDRGSDAQTARDSGNRQPRGVVPNETRSATLPEDVAPTDQSSAEPSGIYV